MSQTITVRLVPPQGISIESIALAVKPQVEREVWRRLGPNVEVRLEEGKTQDVRLAGLFALKAGEVRQIVGEALGAALDHLDADALSLRATLP